jgi:hypothetical protein
MAAAESIGGVAPKTPVHLWIVGVLAILWNFVGVFDYLATKLELEFYMSQFPPEMLEWINDMPAWATASWAFGVWGAFVGTIGLLLRKKWALWAYVASIGGLLISNIYSFFLSNVAEAMGESYPYMNALIWVIALFLLFYACAMSKKGVLR